FFHGAGTKVLNKHISLGSQGAYHVLPLFLAQIDADGLLATGLGLPPDGGAFVQQSPFTQRIAIAWRLNLDNGRAEVCQRFGSEWPCDQLPQFEYLDAGENLPCHESSCALRGMWRGFGHISR